MATGADAPASRRAAILEALAQLPPDAAGWLLTAEWRQDRRLPVVRAIRRLRDGQGTAQEAIAALLGAFHGSPLPPPKARPLRSPERPREPPAPLPDAPGRLLLWWLRPRPPRKPRRRGRPPG